MLPKMFTASDMTLYSCFIRGVESQKLNEERISKDHQSEPNAVNKSSVMKSGKLPLIEEYGGNLEL